MIILSNRMLMVAALLTLAGSSALAADRAAEGKVIAERWCAACHQISLEQTTASVDVPSFMTIAKLGTMTDDLAALEGFLSNPHPVMPDLNLTRQEIRDLVAYISSLK